MANVMKQNIKTALEIAQLDVPLWVATNGGLLIIDANYTPTFEINFLR